MTSLPSQHTAHTQPSSLVSNRVAIRLLRSFEPIGHGPIDPLQWRHRHALGNLSTRIAGPGSQLVDLGRRHRNGPRNQHVGPDERSGRLKKAQENGECVTGAKIVASVRHVDSIWPAGVVVPQGRI
jgi:hypothetical protein